MTPYGTQARQQMVMRAHVQRPINEGTDGFGHPRPEKSETVDAAMPCMAWAQVERGERQDNESYASIGNIRVIVPRDSGVLENYTLAEIVDRRNRVVFGAMRVVSVARRPDHLALVCREVAGGRP